MRVRFLRRSRRDGVSYVVGRVLDATPALALKLVERGSAEFTDPACVEAYGMLAWIRNTNHEGTVLRLAEMLQASHSPSK
jgi:hypothetical protein